jgi:hypothetical protein
MAVKQRLSTERITLRRRTGKTCERDGAAGDDYPRMLNNI